jgi:hypothetical protein
MPPLLAEIDEATPAIRQVIRRLDRRFGVRIASAGVFVCRNIAGSSSPSQHAWGNAVDVVGSRTALDAVARFARSQTMRRYVSQVLWQVPDHYGHVHISGRPYREGTPPCMTPGGGPEGPGGTGPGPGRGGRVRPIPSPAATVAGEAFSPAFRASRRHWSRTAAVASRAAGVIRRSMR